MTTILAAMPSPLAIKVVKPSDWLDEELYEQDLEFSDDSDMTDDSSYTSPVSTPTAAKSDAKVAASPCSVEDVASAWSAPPTRRKRARMSEDERKVRHREVQRQFMKRKRARIAVLRKEQCQIEMQLRLVRVLKEVQELKNENESLKQQYEACERADFDCEVSEPEPVVPMSFGDLVFSVPSEETHEDYEMTEEDWSLLYDMLSDDASDSSDSPSICPAEVEMAAEPSSD